MKVAKIRRNEEKKGNKDYQGYTIKSMVKILFSLVLIFCVFYFITIVVLKNKEESKISTPSVVDSTKIIVSQILNRNQSEYYVMATMGSLYESSYIDTNYITIYNDYINKYTQKESSLAFYYVDLDSALNKRYIGDELNIVDDIEKLRLNDEVLFKIKDGMIEKYYVGKDKILDKLSRL